ncbi:MAG: C39 family peptidase [Pseudomonadota bacterium]
MSFEFLAMQKFIPRWGLVFLGATCAPMTLADAMITTPTLHGPVATQSWKDRRDAHIVKQDLDFSCGAASMATILTNFYGKAVTEADILKAMRKDDAMASFADMAAVLPQYGFKGAGLALSFDQLRKIKVPAIVYLRYRGDDHFSVLRGISEDTVWLGDPSWGNRRLSVYQFLAMWETRDDPDYKGKVLLILPSSTSDTAIQDAFFHAPEPNPLAAELLGVRQF